MIVVNSITTGRLRETVMLIWPSVSENEFDTPDLDNLRF